MNCLCGKKGNIYTVPGLDENVTICRSCQNKLEGDILALGADAALAWHKANGVLGYLQPQLNFVEVQDKFTGVKPNVQIKEESRITRTSTRKNSRSRDYVAAGQLPLLFEFSCEAGEQYA